MKAFVTGGAGFIGSHIVDQLVKDGHDVTIYDNFSTGREQFIAHLDVPVVRADVLDLEKLKEAMAGHDIVFHFQANADVRGGIDNTRVDLEQNTIATWNVLDCMRELGIKKIVFSSSATVYGEPASFPTPENYSPLQTSLYGASKLSCEAMIQSYCEYYDMQSWIFRFVSWIGERYTHGVIFDFMKKLENNPKELEILGDGKQKKSYLDVKDGVAGIFHAVTHAKEKVNIFNLGHDDWMNVLDLADIVIKELGLADVSYNILGGERGWKGDSPFVHLDTTKLKDLGWKPQVSIEQGIKNTVAYLQANKDVLSGRDIGK
ncbi:MAG: NAD-dependent epimerase/dehydratase family protein [Candidatus Woesearchaeota archaeon]|nr:NAD-dependent epimerase/dehydratase family protein [Candidatus Woesearchaeota archaeon]